MSDALPIIFIHKGDSFYLKYALMNANKFNPDSRVILLGDGVSTYPDFVEYHKISDYSKSALYFRSIYKHMSKTPESIERFCFERWFILDEFLRVNNLKKAFTIDSDVLLFEDITKDSINFIEFSFTLAHKASGGLVFINSSAAIHRFCKFVLSLYEDKSLKIVKANLAREVKKFGMGNISDMSVFKEFYKKNSNEIGEITEIINDSTYDSMINGDQGGFEMDDGIKKIMFINELPYGILNGKKVRLKCLHFAGQYKFYMRYFCKGGLGVLSKLKINMSMWIRNNISGRLTDSQRNFIKKVMLFTGF